MWAQAAVSTCYLAQVTSDTKGLSGVFHGAPCAYPGHLRKPETCFQTSRTIQICIASNKYFPKIPCRKFGGHTLQQHVRAAENRKRYSENNCNTLFVFSGNRFGWHELLAQRVVTRSSGAAQRQWTCRCHVVGLRLQCVNDLVLVNGWRHGQCHQLGAGAGSRRCC